MNYIGIDPGKSGAIAVVNTFGNLVAWKKSDATESDLGEFLREHSQDSFAVIEKVNAMPGNRKG